MSVEAMLALKRRHLMPCVYHFYQRPMVLARGLGAWLWDEEGKAYLDAYSGVGVVNCGHCQPDIVAAAERQLGRLQHTTTIYLTEPMLRLAAELTGFVGHGLDRAFFCTSGSEANETALLLARLATGRAGFAALTRSLHGRTHLTMGVTGMAFWRSDPFLNAPVHFSPVPHCGACPWGQQPAACDLACAEAVATLFRDHPGQIAAFIAEPILGNGGIVPLPAPFLARVRELTRQHGALMILDEAQTGFCRTGRRFGFQHAGVAPDLVTLCKGLGNGLPIAACLATEAVAAAYTRPGASTFGGNLVCAEAARATLRVLTGQRLDERAARLGARLRGQLEGLARQSSLIRAVRGQGLMLGLELVDGVLDDLLERLKELGVLAGKTGPERNVLTLMPPLVITEEEVALLVERLHEALAIRNGEIKG